MPIPWIVSFALAVGASYVVNRLFAPPVPTGPADMGDQQRSRAASTATLPVLHGSWDTTGREIYLGANTDNTIGYFAIALGSIPDGASITFDKVIVDDIEVTLDADGNVTAGIDQSGNPVDKYNSRLRFIRHAGGRSALLEGNTNDWNASFVADRVAYASVSLDRDREAGLVQLPQNIRFTGASSANNPADAVEQMLTDTRYGLGKSSSIIGSTFAEHRAYCNELVESMDSSGTTQMLPRFTVDGPVSTSDDVITRCNQILAHQNASLGYNNGRYEIYANKLLPTASLLQVDETWFTSGIEWSDTSGALFTDLKINYGRNEDNMYQPNEIYQTTPTGIRKPNQEYKLDTVDLPYCNDSIQVQRAAAIYINESVAPLTIRIGMDVRAMQLEPQQLIEVTSDKYGFASKLFQVKEIDEEELNNGSLRYRVLLREYAAANYQDSVIQQVDPAPNSSFADPSVIGAVVDLNTINVFPDLDVPNFQVAWTVPANSLIDRYDIYVSDISTDFSFAERLATVVPIGGAASFSPGSGVTYTITTELTPGIWNFWVVGRNSFGMSPESNRVNLSWNPVFAGEDGQGTVIEILYANDVDQPGNPTTQPTRWSTIPVRLNGTDIMDEATGTYDPTDAGTISVLTQNVNFRGAITSPTQAYNALIFEPVDWPDSGPFNVAFTNSSAFLDGVQRSNLFDNLTSADELSITITAGSATATYTITQVFQSALGNVVQLDTSTRSAVSGVPPSTTGDSITLSFTRTTYPAARWRAERVGSIIPPATTPVFQDWNVGQFIGDTGVTGDSTFIAFADDFRVVESTYPNNGDGFAVENLGTVHHRLGNSYSWPPAPALVLGPTSGLSYIPGGGSSTLQSTAQAVINNVGTTTYDFTNGRIDLQGTMHQLPADGDTSGTLFVRIAAGGTAFVGQAQITTLGTFTISVTAPFSGAGDLTLDPNESMSFNLFESTGSDQDFVYTIDHVRFSTTQTEFLPTTQGSVEVVNFSLTALDTSLFVGTFSGNSRPNDDGEYAWTRYVGTDGLTGFSQARARVYLDSLNVPVSAPVDPGLYDLASGTLTFNGATMSNGWSTMIPPTIANTLYIREASVVSRDTIHLIDPLEWSSPIASSATAVNGDDGISSGPVTLFRRTNDGTTPASPNADTYSFTTGLVTTDPNNGWSQTPPEFTGNNGFLWFVTAQALSNTATAMIPGWSTPQVLSRNGADGLPGVSGSSVIIYYADDQNGLNASTQQGSREFVQYVEFVAGTGIPTPPTSGYVRFVGDIGGDGMSVFPIYATDAAGNGQTFTPSDSARFVTFFEAVVQPTLPVNGQTFVEYFGEDGAQGPAGQSQRTVNLYRLNDNSIVSSAGSFNGPRDGNTSWSFGVPDLNSDGDTAYVSTRTFTSDGLAPQDASWSTPAIYSRRIDGSDGASGTRGAGRWNYRVGPSLASSYSEAQLNGFLALVVPGTAGDGPIEGDQLWLFSSVSTTNLIPTAQLVYLYNGSSWVQQQEVVDGNLVVDGTVTAEKLQAQSISGLGLTIGTLSSSPTGERIEISDNRIRVFDSNNVVRVTIGDLS